MTHFCHKCMQYKHEYSFTIWFEDKRKARYCDSCHDDINVKRIISNQKENALAKKEKGDSGITQSQIGLSEEKKSKSSLSARRKIEELKELARIKAEHEL